MHWWGCVLLSLKVHLDNNKALGPEEMLRWCQMRIGVLVMKWKRCSMISGKNTRIMDDVRGFMIWIQHRISNCQRYFRDGLYDMLWFANVECHENLDFGLRILCMSACGQLCHFFISPFLFIWVHHFIFFETPLR